MGTTGGELLAGMGRQGFGRRIVPRNMVPRWGTCPLKGALLTDPGGWHQRYPSCPPFLPEITGKRGMQGGELLETPPSVVANATVARSSPRSVLHRHPGVNTGGPVPCRYDRTKIPIFSSSWGVSSNAMTAIFW